MESNFVLLICAVVYGAALVLWVKKGYFVNPFLPAMAVFFISCLTNVESFLLPQYLTPEHLSPAIQWIVLLTAIVLLAGGIILPGNRGNLRIRFFLKWGNPKTWLLGCAAVCSIGLLYSIATTGTIPLLYSAKNFGTGDLNLSEVIGLPILISWAMSTVGFVIFTLHFCTSEVPLREYIRRNKLLIACVAFCLFTDVGSGFRMTIVSKFFIMGALYELTHKVNKPALAIAGISLLSFFVLIGNLRFNDMKIENSLKNDRQFGAMSNTAAWLITYAEPNLKNLQNFVDFRPEPKHGEVILAALIPSFFHEKLGIERANSAQFLAEKDLYSYHGLTFRTIYPDLIMDFGLWGGVCAGLLVISGMIFLQYQAQTSPSWIPGFLCVVPSILAIPLATELTKLYAVTPLVLCTLLIRVWRVEASPAQMYTPPQPLTMERALRRPSQ